MLPVTPALLLPILAALVLQSPFPGSSTDPRAPARVTVQAAVESPAVVPGRPFTVRVLVTPAPGIHVYAPGNRDYIPVRFELVAAGVRVKEVVYPPAEDYVFGELKELVRVYSKPFVLRQDVLVTRAAARPGTAMTLTGTLHYQACDDRVCFPRASAPVEITIPIAAASARRPETTRRPDSGAAGTPRHPDRKQ